MSDMTVANTILQQLGAGRFTLMTGSKDYVAGDNFLMFRLGSGAAKGINKIRITLTPADTYTVEFFRIRGTKFAVVETVEDVYNDSLRDVISRVTGFTLAVPRIIGINA